MRTLAGTLAVSAVGLLLGVLAVSQFRSQDVYSRSLQLETPASLTTVIANLAEKNSALREEIFDLRRRVEAAQDAIATGKGSLAESERQIKQLLVFAALSAVGGPGVEVRIEGQFDERALSDLVNELRNSGAEALSVNDIRVGPRSHFGPASATALTVDGGRVSGPWTVRAIGAPDVLSVALTRTGGIIGQFELIYARTRFAVTKQPALQLGPPR